MFGLLRRISGSIIPRPDRPWQEDATSNAPQIGRKRRLSSTDRGLEETDDERAAKKGRSVNPATSPADGEQGLNSAIVEGVKEVTKGVKEVDLDATVGAPVAPENIPLPEEASGELDESSSTPPPAAQTTSAEEEAQHIAQKTKVDKDDVSSSRSSSVAPQAVEEGAKEKGDAPDVVPGLVPSTVDSTPLNDQTPIDTPSGEVSDPDRDGEGSEDNN